MFKNLEGIDLDKWTGLKSIIRVSRKIIEKDKVTKEVSYFISSLSPKTDIKILSSGIRGHWSIESFHYIKDVTFGEDKSKVRTNNAPANYSLMRNFAISIFRKNDLDKIQEAIEKCANNIPYMMGLI